jgi:hypothetical protein
VPASRRIRLLGRPHAGGVQLRGNKPWAITAYLALAGAQVPRTRIISLLFDSAQDPTGTLRWNLGQVRRLLGRPGGLSGPVLSLPDDGSVCFDVDLLAAARWQDAVEMEGLVTRSLPARGGHLWSHVWALTDAVRLGLRLGDPRHVTWQAEALAHAQRCGMRVPAGQLLQVPGCQEA